MLLLFIAAAIPAAHTTSALPPQGPGLSLSNGGCCPKAASNPSSSQYGLSPRAQILPGAGSGLKPPLLKALEGHECCTPPPSNLMRDRQMHRDEWMSSCLASPLCSETRRAQSQSHGTAMRKPPRAGAHGGWQFLSFLIPLMFNKRETEAGRKQERALLAHSAGTEPFAGQAVSFKGC